ncbi:MULTISPECIES: tetratricopeptide repeat protein [Glycomyces]|uniref:Tetratricopeptide (TPR) repeat protein n=2 Tax=Glycomyces TaxID=58113 RepID=A0A9X3PPS4_9ACTN|nr:tetratricopeptide repeat protein [Glycomyces lechevalierae]MDA1387603.1 tetratricopeptide repeat protein [Glycomyces lechevalierae]MDR7336631.1 tetratricopeptide (TPR) repeat protein [Glycomyces lechevalierae]
MLDPYAGSSRPQIAARLGRMLAAHLEHSGQPVADLARELRVSPETVRSWLALTQGRLDEANEFAHFDTTVKLGAWLRARIADSGLSVRHIAEATESVSVTTVYNWLKGAHLPPPPTGDEPDRFDLLLSHPALGLSTRQRVQLDEMRRRLTGTSASVPDEIDAWPVRNLPADNTAFTGRGSQLRRLDKLLLGHARRPAGTFAAITGFGGVGKTSLAVHWVRTREVRAMFPDGCLYLNLNGYAATAPTTSADAAAKMLVQLGVDPKEIPGDADARFALYQQSLARMRLLLVLDNVHSAAQVRPLMPTAASVFTVITSRSRLSGLAATHPELLSLPIDLLTTSEAVSLLRRLLGPLVLRTETDAGLRALAEACGHVPLALQVAAANFLNHHSRAVSMGEYASALKADPIGHLAVEPDDPATAVGTAMDHSYAHLTAAGARAYRLLSLHFGQDFSLAAAAGALAQTRTAASTALTELVHANLLERDRAGRYAFHDLIRDHAAAKAVRFETEADRAAATDRMRDFYLHTAYTAALLIRSGRDPIAIGPCDPAVRPEILTDQEEATAWLTAEQDAILAAIDRAAERGDIEHAWQLAWSVGEHLNRQGNWHEQIKAGSAVLTSAVRSEDDHASLRALRQIAQAEISLGRLDDAEVHLRESLAYAERLGDTDLQANDHHSIATVLGGQRRRSEAIEHSRTAIRLYRIAGNRRGQAFALNSVGWLLAQQGAYSEALAYCLDALAIHQALDNPSGIANTSDSLGYIHRRLGNRAQSIDAYQAAIAGFQSIGDRFSHASSLRALAEAHRDFNDATAARTAWEKALTLLDELDHTDAEIVRTELDHLD